MKKPFSIFLCLMLLSIVASAHAGRTDASGGHWDRSDGTYHYHHGYPAHQHTNGICPYDYNNLTGYNSGSSSLTSTVASVSYENDSGDYGPEAETDFETKRDAFYSGFEWGVEYSHDDDIAGSAYNDGYADGYNQGYSDGETVGYDNAHQKGYDEGYDIGYDEGYSKNTKESETKAYNSGYKDATTKYEWIIIIIGIAFIMLIIAIYKFLKTKILHSEHTVQKQNAIINDICLKLNKSENHTLTIKDVEQIFNNRK